MLEWAYSSLKCFVYTPYRKHWCMHAYKQHSWSFFDQIKIFFFSMEIINFESSITLNKKILFWILLFCTHAYTCMIVMINTHPRHHRQRTCTWTFCWTKKCYCCFALVVFFLVWDYSEGWMLYKTLWNKTRANLFLSQFGQKSLKMSWLTALPQLVRVR